MAAANYLDSITIGATTYDNADADGCPDNTVPPCGSAGEEFVVYANPQAAGTFNDRLVYITVDELMRAAEKRVLGEMAAALNAYRAAYGAYPWLADFRSPRAVSFGTSSGGSGTQLIDADAIPKPMDFIADGVQVGDIVVNLDDGSSGPVTAVTTTTITFDALTGGAANVFDGLGGEQYEIRPSFKSTLSRRGQVPIHLPNEIFRTSFTASWNLDDIDDYGEGDVTLQPNPADIYNYSINVATADGRCMWTEADRVDCYGEQVIPNFFRTDLGYAVDERLIQVQFSFSGRVGTVPSPATVTAPTAGDVRRRSVTIFSDYDVAGDPPIPELSPVSAPNLPQDFWAPIGDGDTWTVRVTDTLSGNGGSTLLVIDSDTDGSISVNGIRYDMSVVYDDVDDARDEIPEWLAENNWHHFIFATFAEDFMAGGDADCVSSTTCLTLNVAGVDTLISVEGLLLSAGVEWTNQDRTIGDCDGDGGGPQSDPTDDSFLCAYFDSVDTTTYDVSTDLLHHGQNTQAINLDFYAREVFGANYNDQVRIVAPLPP